MRKLFLLFILAFGMTYLGCGQVTLPHYEPMNYTVGQGLQTQTDWTPLNSGDALLIASGNLSYAGLPASTGNKVTFDGAGIDAAMLFTQQTSGTVYYSFLLDVTSLGSLNTTGGYFTGFNEGTGSNYGATVWTRKDGTGYDIGINPRTTVTNTVWSTATVINTTVFIVISYQMVTGTTNDVVKMWINPTPGGTEPAATASATNTGTDLANVDRILIRQDAAATTPFIQMDELRIGTTWADVTPAGSAGAPTHLAVISVNGGVAPTTGVPFSVQVQAQDVSNNAANVTSDCGISLTSTGTIGGTTTGTILNGQNTVTISGVTLQEGYNLTITAAQTSGTPTLIAGTSAAFNVLAANPNYQTKTSGNWNAPGTWQIQIGGTWYDASDYPNATSKNVIILNSHTVTVTDNAGNCNNLTVNNGGKLWDNNASTTYFVDVYGDITNNGTIGSSDGGTTVDLVSLYIDGTSCTISGSGSFDAGRMSKNTTTNLTTNITIGMNIILRYTNASSAAFYNGAGVTTTLNVVINPLSSLTCPNAKIDLTYSTLTINSDATGTGALLDNGTITNNANVQVKRFLTSYITSDDKKYHIISSPVTAQAIQPGFVANPPNSGDDFYKWDEPITTWINSKDGSGNWNSLFETNFGIGTGYLVAYPTDQTKTFSGALNTYPAASPLVLTCSYTLFASGGYDGWNMIGNPFVASLDWNQVTKGDGVDNALYYYDASIQNYRYFLQLVSGTSIGGGSQYIPPMQGFFVHANGNETQRTVTINNFMRTTSGLGTFYKESKSIPENYLVLKVDNETFSDETYIVLFEQASANYDGKFDALKKGTMNPQIPMLYTITPDNTDLAINSLPASAAKTALPLGFKAGSDGSYTLTASELNSFVSGSTITLEDMKAGKTQNLMQNPVYSFTASTSDDDQRFLLHFSGPFGINDPAEPAGVSFYSNGNHIYITAEKTTGSGRVFIYNLLGQEVFSKELQSGNTNILTPNVISGYYIIRIVTDKGTVNEKVFLN
jgi:hypothetical protein